MAYLLLYSFSSSHLSCLSTLELYEAFAINRILAACLFSKVFHPFQTVSFAQCHQIPSFPQPSVSNIQYPQMMKSSFHSIRSCSASSSSSSTTPAQPPPIHSPPNHGQEIQTQSNPHPRPRPLRRHLRPRRHPPRNVATPVPRHWRPRATIHREEQEGTVLLIIKTCNATH